MDGASPSHQDQITRSQADRTNAHCSASIANLIDESIQLDHAGQFAAALQRAQAALKQAHAAGDSEAIATALNAMALEHFRLGHYDRACALAEQSLTLAAADSPARAEALQRLGACADETGALTEAEEYFLRVVDLAREIGDHLLHLRALHSLSTGVYLPRGQFELARAADEEACRIAHEQDLRDWLQFPLVTLVWNHYLTGQPQKAYAALAELNQVVVPGSFNKGYALCLTANLTEDEGNAEGALDLYSRARSIAETTGEPWLNIEVRLGLSRHYRIAGDSPNALAWADDAFAFATRVGYRLEQSRALMERARALWRCGDSIAAEADLRSAIELLTPGQAHFDLARVCLLLAALLHTQQRAEADVVWLEAVSRIVSGGFAFLIDRERALAYPLVAAYLGHTDTALAAISTQLVEQLQRVPPPPLRIVTLGRFEVWRGRQIIGPRSLRRRRAGDLLILLLLAPDRATGRTPDRALAFNQIAEALWPEKDPAAAQIAFHHATSALRRALEPGLPDKLPSRYLQVEDGRITFHLPPGSELDFEQMGELCRRGEWESALSLYGGDFLPDCLYADWSIGPRQRLALAYQQALLAAAQARLAASHFSEALDACRRLLAAEPWHEQAVLLGMRACVAQNDVNTARRLYRTLEETLRQELDVAPQAELQNFYRSLTSIRQNLEQ